LAVPTSQFSPPSPFSYTGNSSHLFQQTGREEFEMKIHIREIDHVVIRAQDAAALTRFYCEVLGCSVEKEQRDLGLTQLRAGRSLIDLLQVGAKLDHAENGTPGVGRNMDHLCLRIEPFDANALNAHLREHGLQPGDAALRYGADGFGPSIYLFDPEGNMVELKGPPEAARATSL
jgi:glyoxylase I family protein